MKEWFFKIKEWFFNKFDRVGLVRIKIFSTYEAVKITNPHSIFFDNSSDILLIEDEDGDQYAFPKSNIERIDFIRKRNIDKYKKRKRTDER